MTSDSAGNADDANKRHMGLFSGISLIVGSIIGSGIFISPKVVTEAAGSLGMALLIWIIGGLICIPGAISYAELGCLVPSSGGDYTYIKEAFGDLMGFLRVWSEVIITRPCILSVNALTAFEYVLYPFVGRCAQPISQKLLACVGIMTITILNALSLQGPVVFQNIGTVGKVTALLVIVGAGFYQLGMGYYHEFTNAFAGTNKNVLSLVVAVYAGLFPYSGWNYLNNAIEELQNPARNLPIAIFVSLIFCIVIYVLTFASYFTAMSTLEVKTMDATAVVFIERIYAPLRYVLPFFICLSAMGGLNGNLFSISRMFFVAGRDGLFPGVTATRHMTFNTPIVSTLIEGMLGCMYIFAGDINKLLKYLSFTYWMVTVVAVLSLPIIRKRFKAPEGVKIVKAGNVLPVIYVAAIGLLTVASLCGSKEDSQDFLIGLLIVCSGIPVYFVFILLKKPPKIQQYIKKATVCLQKALNSYPDMHDPTKDVEL